MRSYYFIIIFFLFIIISIFYKKKENFNVQQKNIKKKKKYKKNNLISLIILSYNRPDNLNYSIPILNDIDLIDEIIIAHGSKEHYTEIKGKKVINIKDFVNNKKYLTFRRFDLYKKCKNDCIMILDDDLLPSNILIEKMYYEYLKDKLGFYGNFIRNCDKYGYSAPINLDKEFIGNYLLTGCCMLDKNIIKKCWNYILNKKFALLNKIVNYFNGNCEDLLFNNVYYNLYKKKPTYVEGMIINLNYEKGYSSNPIHYLIRNKFCIDINNNNITYLDIKNIFAHSLMIYLKKNDTSIKRISQIKKIYSHYEIKLNLIEALDWKDDEKKLLKLPLLRKKPQFWEGAWGLAGSFYKALKFAYKHNYPYMLFLEDDSIPSLEKDIFYNNWNKIILDIVKIKDWNKYYYILGFTRYCKLKCGDTNHFLERTKNYGNNGTHSILFTKKTINILMEYLKNNKIDRPIDQWLTKLHDDNILHGYALDGNISNNGMFCGLYEQLDTNCDERINIISKK